MNTWIDKLCSLERLLPSQFCKHSPEKFLGFIHLKSRISLETKDFIQLHECHFPGKHRKSWKKFFTRIKALYCSKIIFSL